jgi:hypothetical protein
MVAAAAGRAVPPPPRRRMRNPVTRGKTPKTVNHKRSQEKGLSLSIWIR